MSTTNPLATLTDHIRCQLPSLNDEQTEELAEVVEQIVALFEPEEVIAFGSRARDDADNDSDVDLMVVVPHSDEPGYRRDQQAYRQIKRRYLFPLDILIVTRAEFDAGRPNPATLPATVLREGKSLYAA